MDAVVLLSPPLEPFQRDLSAKVRNDRTKLVQALRQDSKSANDTQQPDLE